ncbi:MAG: SDR family oxidoreductase, partial [Cereibacter changlensis]
ILSGIMRLPGSVLGGNQHSSVYVATKGAVDTMTFALARELGPRGIRVNSILPGHTNTPATDGTSRAIWA